MKNLGHPVARSFRQGAEAQRDPACAGPPVVLAHLSAGSLGRDRRGRLLHDRNLGALGGWWRFSGWVFGHYGEQIALASGTELWHPAGKLVKSPMGSPSQDRDAGFESRWGHQLIFVDGVAHVFAKCLCRARDWIDSTGMPWPCRGDPRTVLSWGSCRST